MGRGGDTSDAGPAAGHETPAEVAALAEAITRGEDSIKVPEVLTGDDVEDPSQDPFRSFIVRVRFMSIPERMKVALRGNKEARTVLMRDSNKVIQKLVLQNPRITEDEIVSVVNNRSIGEEMLRGITARREWMKNYQVRLGLVTNPKTPVALALRYLGTLDDRDVRRLAKSKNVPDAVGGAARRTVAARQLRGQ